jgi:hypothetical protein
LTDTSRIEARPLGYTAPDPHLTVRRARAISGVVAGVVTLAGLVGTTLVPGGGTTSAKSVLDYYDSSGKRASAVALGFVLIAGCLIMMWFFSELKARLADNRSTRVAHLFAVFGAAAIAVGNCILLGPTGVQMNTGQHFVGVPVATALAQSGLFVMIGCGVYSIAVAIFLISLEARRQRTALPRWLATSGLVVAVLLVGSYVGAPVVLLPVWLVVAGLASRSTSRLAA